MEKLAILLTTYNSTRYLEELLQSIQEQTFKEWKLFIRDDMSTDNTLDILTRYASEDARIQIIPDDKKRGAKDGFMWLLANTNAEYYMFCDHDDIWAPDKISYSLEQMEAQTDSDNKPVIVCCDLTVIDGQGKVISDSFFRFRHYDKSLFNDKYFHLVYNCIPGCTMLLNSTAKVLAFPYSEEIRMHDSWLAISTLWNGGRIEVIDKQLISYRIHDSNTIGAAAVPSFLQQSCRFRTLLAKTRKQYLCSKGLHNLSYTQFICVKLWYMFRIHLSHLFH
ncbi:MAG: glycosyltransferase family 2 protein [Prevotella sp.]|nr:glycosyltransferase family 2 protein [Prevotella sp.]